MASISAYVRAASKEAGLDEVSAYQVETAVDEACSNIIEHAYGGEGNGDIICCCESSPGNVTITLKDTGRPFDPSNVPSPEIQAPLEEREPHGLGLYFINQLMDEVRFDFSDPKVNVLVMKKRKK